MWGQGGYRTSNFWKKEKMALLPFIGHVICIIALTTSAKCMQLTDWLARFFVSIVKSLTGAEIPSDKRKWNPQREINSDLIYEPKERPGNNFF